MTCIFNKGGLYIGKDEHDVTNATSINPRIDICIHLWNYRVEYSYMQPSKTDEKHNKTIRYTNGQNAPGDDGHTRARQE